jgi:hypothetical protein
MKEAIAKGFEQDRRECRRGDFGPTHTRNGGELEVEEDARCDVVGGGG